MPRKYHRIPLRRRLGVLREPREFLRGVVARYLSAAVGHQKIALVGEDVTCLWIEQVGGGEITRRIILSCR